MSVSEPPPVKSRPTTDTFFVAGVLSGRVTGAAAMRDPQLLVYGYFEGDSVARVVRRFGASDFGPDGGGRYAATIFDRLVVADSQPAGLRERRWRAIVVASPLPGTGSGITIGTSDWVLRRAGDSTALNLALDIALLERGVPPGRLPVPIPADLATRLGPPNLGAVTDSARQRGADVFVRLTASRTPPLMVFSDTPAAVVLLADAGLQFSAEHGAFVIFEHYSQLGLAGYTVWGHLPGAVASPPTAADVLTRIASLPFVTGVELVATRVADAPIAPTPTVDSERLAGAGAERFIYDSQGPTCLVDSPSSDATGFVACGELILGLGEGAHSADLDESLSVLGARIIRDINPAAPDGQRSILISVPRGTERRAFNTLVSHPKLRYVSLNRGGGLL